MLSCFKLLLLCKFTSYFWELMLFSKILHIIFWPVGLFENANDDEQIA